jgi:starch phosphorylase
MKNFQIYQVHPNIPQNLAFLEILCRNMWWCWKKDAVELFRRIDPRGWVESGRNPIAFLAKIPQDRFEQLAGDDGYLAHLARVKETYQSQVFDPLNGHETPFQPGETIAYFSMEFGLHESLPLFAGGLGILAGDHLKAASNVALPLTGIGLMYHEGYFRQYLNQEGWQQEEYPPTDIYNLPVERIQDPAGNDLTVSIQGPDGPIHAIIWKITVGRIPLYLLDTNVAENTPASREITSRLYAGEAKVRLAQEMLLGLGGIKALAAMGIKAKVLHMNEGHSAFASLQRLVQIMVDHHVDLTTALEIIPRTTVFTTHTPVAAGHDEFAVDLVKPYLKPLEKNCTFQWTKFYPGANPQVQMSMHRFRCLYWPCTCRRIATGSANCTAQWPDGCGPMSGPIALKKKCRFPMSPTVSTYRRLYPRSSPTCSTVTWDPSGI